MRVEVASPKNILQQTFASQVPSFASKKNLTNKTLLVDKKVKFEPCIRVYTAIQGYTQLCTAVQGDTQLDRAMHSNTELYRAIHCYKGLYTAIRSHTQLNRAIHGYTGLHTAIVTGLYTIIQGYTQVYTQLNRAIHSYTELCTDIQRCVKMVGRNIEFWLLFY